MAFSVLKTFLPLFAILFQYRQLFPASNSSVSARLWVRLCQSKGTHQIVMPFLPPVDHKGLTAGSHDPLNCATAQLTYLCNLPLQLQNLCHLLLRVISSSEQLSYFGHVFQISQPRLKQNATTSFKSEVKIWIHNLYWIRRRSL